MSKFFDQSSSSETETESENEIAETFTKKAPAKYFVVFIENYSVE